ncbi:MAG TPA: alpha/beta fold hydrolase [Rubrivivax sp.]|nr:alpha/beta fold hydrolase [Rubrivivax sp.]
MTAAQETPPQGRALEVRAADGETLQAVLYAPAAPTRGAVLVAGGLGIAQGYYKRFCSWLAGRGHTVMSFDPRGIGASRRPEHRRSLRGLHADLLSWARVDFAAAVERLCAQAGQPRIGLVGHSLGFHHAAMTHAATQARLNHVVSVAAGAGYWRDWAAPSRRKAPLMLHLAGPLLTPLLGYFPGRALGMVADLPGPAMRQWTRWCRHPDFAWGCEPHLLQPSLHSARFPITAFSFGDDEAMTVDCTRKLLAALPNAPSTLRVLKPADVGLSAIGHVGAFRREASGLWPLLTADLS